MAEYDTHQVNLGLSAKLWKHLSLNAFTEGFDCIAGGVRYECTLCIRRFILLAVLTGLAGNMRAQLAEKLEAAGMENVKAVRTEQGWVASFEDRLYRSSYEAWERQWKRHWPAKRPVRKRFWW